MKNITIILIILLGHLIYAQYPVLTTTSLMKDEFEEPNHSKNGNYAKDINNERNQYEGLWRYNQNGVLFELKIEKKNQMLNKQEYNGGYN